MMKTSDISKTTNAMHLNTKWQVLTGVIYFEAFEHTIFLMTS